MASKSRKRHRDPKKSRASWQGLLSFGLVAFPVEAFNAFNREGSDIHFHQLHANCHSRVRYKKVCPIHGEISNEEIISGYEYTKGKYIEVKAEELEALRTESDRALKIDAFVSPDTVDPLYFDGRMYYLKPAGTASNEAYAVIVEALEREHRHGIGQLVMSGKDQIALIRPVDGVLHMAMLNFDAEIRAARTVVGVIKTPKGITRQVELAQTLIQEWSQEKFDFTTFSDTYREKVAELIERKKKGHEIAPPAEEKPRGVLNLMDALKKSVANLAKPRASKEKRRTVRHSA